MAPMDDATLMRFADLVVHFGANVQHGPDRLRSLRARQGVPDPRGRGSAYRRGARFVDVAVVRPVGQARADRARARGHARVRARRGTASACSRSATQRAARIALSGPAAPGVLDGLDPVRAGRDRLPAVKESGEVVDDRTTNWTIVPVPDAGVGGARLPRPRAGRGAREARGAAAPRLPARRGRPDRRLAARAPTRSCGAADAAHRPRLRRAPLRGPGHRPHDRAAARRELAGGALRRPSTASSTCPTSRPRRSSRRPTPSAPRASSTSTKPLVLIDGTVVRDLVVRFEGGRAVEIAGLRRRATRCARSSSTDDGAARLGEVALVDREGRIGPLGHRLLRHAARRERRQPHRARPGLPVRARRGGPRPRQREPRSTSTS